MTKANECLERLKEKTDIFEEVMGNGQKMVKDLNDNELVICDAPLNMNGNFPCYKSKGFPNDFDDIHYQEDFYNKDKDGNHWKEINNVISKLNTCDKCVTIQELIFDNNNKIERFGSSTKDFQANPNGHKTSSELKEESELEFDCLVEDTGLSKVIKENNLIIDDANRHFAKTANEEGKLCIEHNQSQTNTDLTSDTVHESGEANSLPLRGNSVTAKADVNDSPSPEHDDSNSYINDPSNLDINNPNLFSDLEDSDDDVFEIDTQRRGVLFPSVSFLTTKILKPHSLSESAISTRSSLRVDKPLQTVSDSAIVTGINTRAKTPQTSARKKSVHFNIFPYIIEIPRVADLEEEFYEAELERYGNAQSAISSVYTWPPYKSAYWKKILFLTTKTYVVGN